MTKGQGTALRAETENHRNRAPVAQQLLIKVLEAEAAARKRGGLEGGGHVRKRSSPERLRGGLGGEGVVPGRCIGALMRRKASLGKRWSWKAERCPGRRMMISPGKRRWSWEENGLVLEGGEVVL